jgi:hypothetical protein
VSERAILKNFEDFAGLDNRRSPLTAQSNECTSLKNLKFAEGVSLSSRFGFRKLAQEAGFVSGDSFSYFDKETGATREVLVGINDSLWYLTDGTFTVSRSGGVAWTWRWYPTAAGTTITIELIEGGAVAHTTTFTASNTVRDVYEWIDGLANYSCSYSGEFARVNSAAGNYTTITVDNPHTYQFGDLVTLYDTYSPYFSSSKGYLSARRVESTTATTIVISGNTDYAATSGAGVGVVDNQVLGPLASYASSIYYKGAEVDTTADKTITFSYWAPAIWNSFNDLPFKTFHSLSRSQDDAWRHASFVSAGNRLFIGTYAGGDKSSYTTTQPQRSWEGFPHCFDGREVYRAGIPKPVADGIGNTAGGTVPAGTYRWKLQFKYTSKNGDIIFSQPTDDTEGALTTTAARYFTITVRVPTVRQLDKSATVVTLTASNVNTIQVFNLDWLYTSDNRDWEVLILNRRASPIRYEIRKITSFNSTGPTITIDGPPVDVTNLDEIYYVDHGGGPYRGGDATAVATNVFTISANHNIYPGDTVYFCAGQYSTATATERKVEARLVTAVTATTVTVEGPNLSAVTAPGCAVSAGLTLELYRTKAGGLIYYKAAETACHCTGTSNLITIIDNCSDDELGEQLIEPEIGRERDVPPQASIVLGHQGGLVYTGIPNEPNALAWNAIEEGLEAVPLASNYTDIASGQVGPITAAASISDDSLLVFKPAAAYALSGDLSGGAFVSRPMSEGDYGISSHASVKKLNGIVVGVGKLGIMLFNQQGAVKEFAEGINTQIVNNRSLVLEQACAVNDYSNRQYRIFIPSVTPTDIPVTSLMYSFDYERGAWFNSEIPIVSSQPAGGMFMYENTMGWFARQGYGFSYPSGEGCAFQETSYSGGGAFSPNWLYCDALMLPSYVYTTDWIHLGEPSFKKLFLRLKLFRFIPNGEQGKVSSELSATVSFYRDWNEGTPFFTSTVGFGLNSQYSDVERTIKLLNASAKAIKLKVEFSGTTLQTFFLSGWELAVATPYKTTDFLPAPGSASGVPDPT